MITIDGHTFENENYAGLLFSPNGYTIDAGARGFEFSKYCHDALGQKVIALDIENFDDIPKGIKFKQAALSSQSGTIDAYLFGNGTANFVKGINETPGNTEDRPCKTITVPAITLQDIYNDIGTDIDLLKLDIEGSEYEILLDIKPIPKQITVEFHEHVHEHLHSKYFDKVIAHLCKYYDFHAFNIEPRYKYLDCLFTKKKKYERIIFIKRNGK